MSYIPNLSPKNGAPLLSGFEALVVKTNGAWFGVRAKSVFKLLAYQPEQIRVIEQPIVNEFPALLGFLESVGLVVLDLGRLLELPQPDEAAEPLQQILVVKNDSFPVGLAIQSALEIERTSVSDIRLLPPLIETARLKPVVWAFWQRQNEELLPMIDPLEAVPPEKWQWLAALQLELSSEPL